MHAIHEGWYARKVLLMLLNRWLDRVWCQYDLLPADTARAVQTLLCDSKGLLYSGGSDTTVRVWDISRW